MMLFIPFLYLIDIDYSFIAGKPLRDSAVSADEGKFDFYEIRAVYVDICSK